jgi:hypothetical protein
MNMSEYTTDDILRVMAEETDGIGTTPKVDGRGAHLQGLGGPGCKPRPWKEYSATGDQASAELHNTEIPKAYAKIEKYEHRVVAFLKVQGYSGVEIAEITGYTKNTIYGVLKLPWVRALIIEEIKNAGRDAAHELLHASALDTISFLIDTVQDDKVQRRDRIAAAKEHLNRVYGMPNQPITYQEKVDLDTLTDEALAKIAFRGEGATN